MGIIQNNMTIGSWVIRTREPSTLGSHPVILMLHGLTGDENSMWVFAPRISEEYLIITIRGPYSSSLTI